MKKHILFALISAAAGLSFLGLLFGIMVLWCMYPISIPISMGAILFLTVSVPCYGFLQEHYK